MFITIKIQVCFLSVIAGMEDWTQDLQVLRLMIAPLRIV